MSFPPVTRDELCIRDRDREKDRAAYCASRTVTQVRAKIEHTYKKTPWPSPA